MTATNCWLYTSAAGYAPFTNVTFKRGTWRQSYTWNDNPSVTPGSVGDTNASGTTSLLSAPVHLTSPGPTDVASPVYAPIIPDEWAHLPPRYGFRPVDGYIIALPGATLPTVQDTWDVPRWASSVVTIDLTSNVITSAGNHSLESGDVIALSTTGALPTGVTATDLLTVEKMSATTYRVLKNGLLVDFTGTQSGVHTSVLVTSVLPLSMPAFPGEGLVYVPDDGATFITNSNPYVRA